MTLKLANAPCSWGVEFAGSPDNPTWQQVLEEIQGAGFTGTELGPIGYMPEDAIMLKEQLDQHQLHVIAGTLFQHLHDADKYKEIIDIAHRTCSLLSKLDAEYLVVISHVASPRTEQAGQMTTATRLDAGTWQHMISTIDECARICLDYGITPTLHSHTGSYLEYEDELTRAAEELSEERVKLCIDTGHCLYAGMDPAEIIKRYGDRVAYLHMKDINPTVYQSVIENGTDFYSAVKQGVFCPIGQGAVNFTEVKQALTDIQFGGWMTVEQDTDPLSGNKPLQYAIESQQYLNKLLATGS